MNQSASAGWLLPFIFSLLFSLGSGLAIVWMSIDRADTAFHISQLQKALSQRGALREKLEIERDRLLDPGDLRRKAEQFGLREAHPGQIRRLPPPDGLPQGER